MNMRQEDGDRTLREWTIEMVQIYVVEAETEDEAIYECEEDNITEIVSHRVLAIKPLARTEE
jgi:hypothetical protein|tara:strand:- start:153 stop:338 length:186 start_codon:yes stop_codon:yes gene_type:complete